MRNPSYNKTESYNNNNNLHISERSGSKEKNQSNNNTQKFIDLSSVLGKSSNDKYNFCSTIKSGRVQADEKISKEKHNLKLLMQNFSRISEKQQNYLKSISNIYDNQSQDKSDIDELKSSDHKKKRNMSKNSLLQANNNNIENPNNNNQKFPENGFYKKNFIELFKNKSHRSSSHDTKITKLKNVKFANETLREKDDTIFMKV